MTHEIKKTNYIICNKVLCKCNRHQKIIYNKKKNIRIMPGCYKKGPCTEIFSKFNILPLANIYLLLVISFTMENSEKT